MHHINRHFLKLLTCGIFLSGMIMQASAAKPTLTATDLVCNGESFFEMTKIRDELSNLAKTDGVLTGNENFKQIAASGQPMSVIMNNFIKCTPKPKYLVTDGGGIDLFQGNCQAGDKNCAKVQECKKGLEAYIAEMKKANVKAFIWMGYPEAPGNQSLTTNQAIWTTVSKEVIAATTGIKAVYVDLLPVFAGHYNEYFNAGDGLHPNLNGSKAAAKAFWDALKADDYAFFDTNKVPTSNKNNTVSSVKQSFIENIVSKSGNVALSLSIDQPSNISLRLINACGRSVYTSQQNVKLSGKQTVVFTPGSTAHGLYLCEVKAGNIVSQSTVFIQ